MQSEERRECSLFPFMGKKTEAQRRSIMVGSNSSEKWVRIVIQVSLA